MIKILKINGVDVNIVLDEDIDEHTYFFGRANSLLRDEIILRGVFIQPLVRDLALKSIDDVRKKLDEILKDGA